MSNYHDLLLFAVLPYLSVFVLLIVSIQRYRAQTFSFSSLSSQFLENKMHFWALVPFHYGILTVIAGHFVAFCVPRSILAWNSVPVRLYILEVSALIAGLLTLLGLIHMIARRATVSKIRTVTSKVDWVLFALLVVQIVTGILVAVLYPWGSSWYAATMTPYLWSLLQFNPDIIYVSALPLMVKLHIVNAFIVVGLFPFTRLVHILVVPNPYLWRRTQVVRWYGEARRAG
ncbi:MAG: Respiratory nitrate reductase 1 gamma chain [bacterium]|nr:Respiratory nitrate reductase 1 gamma chain [bacterium]